MGLDDQAVIQLGIHIIGAAYTGQEFCQGLVFGQQMSGGHGAAVGDDIAVGNQSKGCAGQDITQADDEYISHLPKAECIHEHSASQGADGGTGKCLGVIGKIK